MPINGNNMHGGATVPRRVPTFANVKVPTEDEFKIFVEYLFSSKREGADGFLHAAVGLAGESGEVLDHMKKHWVYDRPLDLDKVLEEMGDTLHYFTQLLIKIHDEEGIMLSFADIMSLNICKLQKRYPNGFTKEDAIIRADKAGG